MRPSVKNMLARSMLGSGERTVAVARHPMEIQPCLQTLYPGGTGNLSHDQGHRLEAKEGTASSSARDVEGATSAKVRRKLVQHGARSVAFARNETTTGQLPGGGGPKGP